MIYVLVLRLHFRSILLQGFGALPTSHALLVASGLEASGTAGEDSRRGGKISS